MVNGNDITECYSIGTLSAEQFLTMQDLFRSVAAECGGLDLPYGIGQALHARGLVAPRVLRGRPVWAPTEKAEAALYLVTPEGCEHFEPRDADTTTLAVRVPEWAR